jgi:hypothetical protein
MNNDILFRQSVDLFLMLIKDTRKKLIGLDGTFTNEDITYLSGIRKDNNAIIMYSSNLERNKKLIVHQEFVIMEQEFIRDANSGMKIIVATSMGIDRIKLMINKLSPNVKVLFIHRDNKDDTALNQDEWLKYDVVIYSPTICEGFSYDYDNFEKMYVFASLMSCPPNSIVQLTGRPRKIKVVHIVFDTRKKQQTYFQDSDEILNYIGTNPSKPLKDMGVYNYELTDNYELKIKKDDLFELFVKNQLAQKCYISFQKNTLDGFRDNGYSIEFLNEVISEELVVELKKQNGVDIQEIKDEKKKMIVNAPIIDQATKDLWESRSMNTEQNRYSIINFDMRRQLKIPNLTMSSWDFIKFHHQIDNIKRMLNLNMKKNTYHSQSWEDVLPRLMADQKEYQTNMIHIKPRTIDLLQDEDEIIKSVMESDTFSEQELFITKRKYRMIVIGISILLRLGFSGVFDTDGLEINEFQTKIRQLCSSWFSIDDFKYYCQSMNISQKNIKNECMVSPSGKVGKNLRVLWIERVLFSIFAIKFVEDNDRIYIQCAITGLKIVNDNSPDGIPYILEKEWIGCDIVILLEKWFNTKMYCKTCKCSISKNQYDTHITSDSHIEKIVKFSNTKEENEFYFKSVAEMNEMLRLETLREADIKQMEENSKIIYKQIQKLEREQQKKLEREQKRLEREDKLLNGVYCNICEKQIPYKTYRRHSRMHQ